MTNDMLSRPVAEIPDINSHPRPLRMVRGPDGRPRMVRRGLRALAAMQANVPRVLRVGVIRGARIVEERVLRTRETITVGASEKCHFVVGDAGFSGRHPLFELQPGLDGERYVLNIADGMTGRVAFAPQDGGVIDLEALQAAGKGTVGRRGLQVPLDDKCKGKITVGDTTLLFQFVVPPPLQPRPQLPASVKGGWVARIDPGLVSSLSVAVLAHIGLLCGTMLPDWPKPTLDEMLASDYSPLQFGPSLSIEDALPPPDETGDQPAAPKEPGDASTKPAGAEPAADPGKTGDPVVDGPKPPSDGPRNPSHSVVDVPDFHANGIDADQLAKIETALDVENLLGAGDGDGPIMGIGREFDGYSASVTDLANAIRNTHGTSDDGSNQGTYSTLDASTLPVAPVGPIGDDGTATDGHVTVPDHDTAVQTPDQAPIVGIVRPVNITPGENNPGQMSGQTFRRVLDRKMSAINSCYNRALIGDPTLAGDLVFRLVINQQGGVRVEVTQNDQRLSVAGVTACIEQRLGTMNFAASPPVGGEFRVRLPLSFIAP
jgi:hypothetical protein